MFTIPDRFREIQRFQDILKAITRNGLGYVLEKVGWKKVHFATKRTIKPVAVRKTLEDVGGAAIKLGQLLSVRIDLLPSVYTLELQRLQDSVKPVSLRDVEGVFVSAFGKGSKKIFSSFQTKPVASASIGQVHIARVKRGKKVAVKVMRPEIKDVVETDIDIVLHFAELLEKSFHPKLFHPLLIAKEFEEYTKRELDYVNEARCIELFRKENKNSLLTIPKVYWEFTNERVLTTEFVEGKKLLDWKKRASVSDKKRVAKLLVNTVFEQIFIQGRFHGDPHPGNILVTKKGIALLDYGITGVVDLEMKKELAQLFVYLIAGKAEAVADSLLRMHIADEQIDKEAFVKDLKAHVGKYYLLDLKHISLSKMILDCFSVARKNSIVFPKDFVVLAKTFVTTEGVCRDLYPGFNIADEARPFAKRLLKEYFNPKKTLVSLFRESKELTNFLFNIPGEANSFMKELKHKDVLLVQIHKEINELTTEVERSTTQVTQTILIASLIIGLSLLYAFNNGFVLGIPVLKYFSLFILLAISYFLIRTFMR